MHRACARESARRARQRDPERFREIQRRWRRKHPKKAAAYAKTHWAIAKGMLVRAPCEACGHEKAEAHHDDYDKPLEVRWLCKLHHMEHHYPNRDS